MHSFYIYILFKSAVYHWWLFVPYTGILYRSAVYMWPCICVTVNLFLDNFRVHYYNTRIISTRPTHIHVIDSYMYTFYIIYIYYNTVETNKCTPLNIIYIAHIMRIYSTGSNHKPIHYTCIYIFIFLGTSEPFFTWFRIMERKK